MVVAACLFARGSSLGLSSRSSNALKSHLLLLAESPLSNSSYSEAYLGHRNCTEFSSLAFGKCTLLKPHTMPQAQLLPLKKQAQHNKTCVPCCPAKTSFPQSKRRMAQPCVPETSRLKPGVHSLIQKAGSDKCLTSPPEATPRQQQKMCIRQLSHSFWASRATAPMTQPLQFCSHALRHTLSMRVCIPYLRRMAGMALMSLPPLPAIVCPCPTPFLSPSLLPAISTGFSVSGLPWTLMPACYLHICACLNCNTHITPFASNSHSASPSCTACQNHDGMIK